MEVLIYIAFFVLFGINGYWVHAYIQIKNRLKQQDAAHKKALAEAGNAITETLRVAFDNLKKNSVDHNKINTKLTEHTGKIHRLEQHIGRAERDFEQRRVDSKDERVLNKRNKERENENK